MSVLVMTLGTDRVTALVSDLDGSDVASMEIRRLFFT